MTTTLSDNAGPAGALPTNVPAERMGTGSPSERLTSRDPDAFPAATSREEEWRFSPLSLLRPLFEAGPSAARLSLVHDLPVGVEVLSVGSDDPAIADVPLPADKLAALALRNADGATVIRVAKGAELERPAVIRLGGNGTEAVAWGHLVIDVGAQATATIVIEYHGSARYAAETSVLVGDGAALSLVQVHGWEADTVHGEHVAARVGRDATYRHTAVSLGGQVVRIVPTVEFAGPGGAAHLFGIAFAGDKQHFESRLFIDHSAPQCFSNVLYKNALQGDHARTVWIGDVRIRPTAQATETFELNRNLLLTPGARADSVPNLEIETGQIVSAGHASATGRFDDLQLFYLQSRGISEPEARRLVVRGFFADVVHRIGLPELEDRLMTEIETRLSKTETENT
jgi:Fe-S cluster assembly protein SufD